MGFTDKRGVLPTPNCSGVFELREGMDTGRGSICHEIFSCSHSVPHACILAIFGDLFHSHKRRIMITKSISPEIFFIFHYALCRDDFFRSVLPSRGQSCQEPKTASFPFLPIQIIHPTHPFFGGSVPRREKTGPHDNVSSRLVSSRLVLPCTTNIGLFAPDSKIRSSQGFKR